MLARTAARCPSPAGSQPLTARDVAVLIPAHNEALVLEESLRSIMALVPGDNVHVVSDGSTDATVEIARRSGARVIETQENVGKAGALEEAIGRFDLISRFPVVMLLDADTRVQPGYFAAALPIFDNPQVVAVAGCVRTEQDRSMTLEGKVLVGHRTRIYAIGQRALKFGQTWLRVNATPIVPGFASLYRTEVLPHIEMNPPGLVIEDFNMTFEVYQKGLGKVGFSLRAVAVTQDPGQPPRLCAPDQAVGGRAVADGPAPPAAGEPVHRHGHPAADRAGHLQPAVLPAPAGPDRAGRAGPGRRAR